MARIQRAGKMSVIGAVFGLPAICLGLLFAQPLGFHSYTVLTGSMAPSLAVGSLILTETVPGSSIRPGDIVTFEVPGRQGMVVTHRVQAIATSGEASYLVTKGDANGVADGWRLPVLAARERVVASLPMAGIINSLPGRLIIFGIPLLVLLRHDIPPTRRPTSELRTAAA